MRRNTYSVQLGQRIAASRQSAGLSMRQVRGVRPSTLSRAERGIGHTRAETVKRLAVIFGVDPGWLLTGSTKSGWKVRALVVPPLPPEAYEKGADHA